MHEQYNHVIFTIFNIYIEIYLEYDYYITYRC